MEAIETIYHEMYMIIILNYQVGMESPSAPPVQKQCRDHHHL